MQKKYYSMDSFLPSDSNRAYPFNWPMVIALQCKLNYTLSHLQSIQSTDPLYGASFYYANDSQALGTSHIRAVISTNLTTAKAETLLYDLTHNPTNARIGNNVTMPSTEALYLLHLPSDVLSSIPSIIVNDGLGPVTNYINLGHEFSNIAQFLFRCLIFVAFGGLILFTHLADIGMKALGRLISSAAATVEQAVHKLWNAFMAFVDWAIEFIGRVLIAIFGPIIQAIQKSYDDFVIGVTVAMELAKSDVIRSGIVASASMKGVVDALTGPIFWVLVAISIAISVALLILKVVTNIFGFLLTIALSMIAGLVIEGALKANQASDSPLNCIFDPLQNFQNWLISWVTKTVSPSPMSWLWTLLANVLAGLSVLWGICGMVSKGAQESPEIKRLLGLDVTWGCIGIIIGTAAAWKGNQALGVLGCIVSGFVVADTFLSASRMRVDDPSPYEISILSGVFGTFGLACSLASLDG
jgi:hypothetical protein